MTHVVVGMGQIGSALYDLLAEQYETVGVDRDSSRNRGIPERPVEVMHVAIPYSDRFEKAVRAWSLMLEPSLTIIHSTVPVGTSTRLGAVHSPVTGKHPNLLPSLKAFRKFFGGTRATEASAIFRACGVQTATTLKPETTEAGKLWQTLQYGWLIAMQKEMFRFCAEVGADPDVAYRRMNMAYNAGYERLEEPYSLAILADMPGPIGGHCVIPNLDLTPTMLADVLAGLNSEW